MEFGEGLRDFLIAQNMTLQAREGAGEGDKEAPGREVRKSHLPSMVRTGRYVPNLEPKEPSRELAKLCK